MSKFVVIFFSVIMSISLVSCESPWEKSKRESIEREEKKILEEQKIKQERQERDKAKIQKKKDEKIKYYDTVEVILSFDIDNSYVQDERIKTLITLPNGEVKEIIFNFFKPMNTIENQNVVNKWTGTKLYYEINNTADTMLWIEKPDEDVNKRLSKEEFYRNDFYTIMSWNERFYSFGELGIDDINYKKIYSLIGDDFQNRNLDEVAPFLKEHMTIPHSSQPHIDIYWEIEVETKIE